MIEYFTSNLWLLWVIISIVCLILELSSGDFFLLCFAIGAAASAIVAGCGANLTVQVIAFAIISGLSLMLVRPALLKKIHKSDKERLSNAEAMIGQTGRVSEPIEAGGYGRVAHHAHHGGVRQGSMATTGNRQAPTARPSTRIHACV